MPAGAHSDMPAALAVGLGCLPAAGCVVTGVAGAVDGAVGVGLAHALP
jgi:hypothetical protein